MTRSNFEQVGQTVRFEHKRQRRRSIRGALLVVEIVAVIGLLLSAGWLWQQRQLLQRDLEVARQIEAAIAAQAGNRLHGQDAVAEESHVACELVDLVSLANSARTPCRLEIPALDVKMFLHTVRAQEDVLPARDVPHEDLTFVISQETYTQLIRRPQQLQGQTVHLAAGERAYIERVGVLHLNGHELASITAHLSTVPASTPESSTPIRQIIMMPDLGNE